MEWRPALCNSPEPSSSLGRRRGEDPQAAVDPEPLGSKWISGFDTSFENSPDRSTPVLCRSVFGCRQFVTRPFVKNIGRRTLSSLSEWALQHNGCARTQRHRPRFRASLPTVCAESHGGRERDELQVRDELEEAGRRKSRYFFTVLPRLFRVPRTRRNRDSPPDG